MLESMGCAAVASAIHALTARPVKQSDAQGLFAFSQEVIGMRSVKAIRKRRAEPPHVALIIETTMASSMTWARLR